MTLFPPFFRGDFICLCDYVVVTEKVCIRSGRGVPVRVLVCPVMFGPETGSWSDIPGGLGVTLSNYVLCQYMQVCLDVRKGQFLSREGPHLSFCYEE